jgi:hypothetical protein
MCTGNRLMATAIAIATAAAVVLAPSASAEIVYTHGTIQPPVSGPWTAPAALWAMGDSGSGPHVLLSPAQVPSDQAAVCCASLQANSATMAFDGLTYGVESTLGDGLYYEGAYALAGGKLTRLSPAPQGSPGDESGDNPLALTADARVVYERVACQNINLLGNPVNCGSTLNVIPDAGGASSSWDYIDGGADNSPPFSFAADPVNAGLLAYVAIGSELLIGNQAATSTTTVATQPDGGSPSFGPDGSQIVDDTSPPLPLSGVNTPAALWLFSATAGATGTELLADPSSPTTAFTNPVFAGPNEIAFAANDNLWEIPTSCNPCTFPSGATQLTTDGTSAAPDSDPAWTSQTITPLAANNNPPPPPPPPPPGTTLKLTVTPASKQKVLKQKGLVATFECNVACGIAVVGGVKIKGTRKPLLASHATGALAANRPDKITLKLSKSELKAIKKALARHKKVTAEVGAAALDSAKQKVQQTKSFTVKH